MGAGTRKERVEGRRKGSEAEGKVAVDEGLWERGRGGEGRCDVRHENMGTRRRKRCSQSRC